MSNDIIDVSADDFVQTVIEESHKRPVLVDFWAAWCGPCRTLKPMLEKLAGEYRGQFRLAKLDVQAHPSTAAQYSVRGIPDVKLFKGGKVVDGFVGLVSAAAVVKLIESYLDQPIDEFFALVAESDDPLALYESHAKEFSQDSRFIFGYGRELLVHNMIEKARDVLIQMKTYDPLYQDAQHLLSLSEVFAAAATVPIEPLDKLLKLAGDSLRSKKTREALDALIEILQGDRSYREGLARKAVIAILSSQKDPDIEKTYRRKLSMTINA
jgi:putative thioredoxin